MATKNDITGDALVSRNATKAYLDNYDLIFGKKDKKKQEQQNTENKIDSEPLQS